jgi:Trp operon repressor
LENKKLMVHIEGHQRRVAQTLATGVASIKRGRKVFDVWETAQERPAYS